MKYYYSIIIMLIILIIPVVLFIFPNELLLQDSVIENVNKILILLLFISLIFERSLDVVLTTIREPKVIDFRNQIMKYEEDLKWLPDDKDLPAEVKKSRLDGLMANLDKSRTRYTEYNSETKKIFLLISFTMGIIISLIGIRILPSIVKTANIDGYRILIIKFIDIILTGGFIAGGSKGINSIFDAFNKMFNMKNN